MELLGIVCKHFGRTQRAVGPGAESCMGQWGPTQGMSLGSGLSCLGVRGARTALQGTQRRDADFCIWNGAGHGVTPMFQRWEGVNQGTRGVHRGRKLSGLSQPLVGPKSVSD